MGTVYTGAARLSQKARDEADALERRQAEERRQRDLDVERRSLQAQLDALQTRLANITAEQELGLSLEKQRDDAGQRAESQMARARKAD